MGVQKNECGDFVKRRQAARAATARHPQAAQVFVDAALQPHSRQTTSLQDACVVSARWLIKAFVQQALWTHSQFVLLLRLSQGISVHKHLVPQQQTNFSTSWSYWSPSFFPRSLLAIEKPCIYVNIFTADRTVATRGPRFFATRCWCSTSSPTNLVLRCGDQTSRRKACLHTHPVYKVSCTVELSDRLLERLSTPVRQSRKQSSEQAHLFNRMYITQKLQCVFPSRRRGALRHEMKMRM